MKTIKKHLLTIALAAGAFIIGSYFGPKEIEIKEVEKVVYKERTEVKTDLKRVVDKKEVVNPDGSKVTETRTTTERVTDKKSEIDVESDRLKETRIESRPSWLVSGTYGFKLDKAPHYSVSIHRRVISELYFGVHADSDKTIGISLAIGF